MVLLVGALMELITGQLRLQELFHFKPGAVVVAVAAAPLLMAAAAAVPDITGQVIGALLQEFNIRLL